MHAISSKRVLVTGATGFIGRHFVRRLIGERCEVSCVVRATSRVEELRDMGASLMTCDLVDRTAIQRALRDAEPDFVFHMAGVVRCVNREEFSRVNGATAEIVAGACAACSPSPVFVLVSSLAASGPCIGDQPRREVDEPAPVSAYGRSKLAGEEAAMAFADRVPMTIVRPPIVFGPGDYGVLQIMRPIARRGVHCVPASGEFRLSLVYVDDLVSGMMDAASSGERAATAPRGRGVYFIAADEHPTYVEFGRMIAKATGRSRIRMIRVPPLCLRGAGRLGDIAGRVRGRPTWINSDKVSEALAGSWVCSSDKAQAQLGWLPSFSIAHALDITSDAHRKAGLF